MRALLLAAGRGSRMGNLTDTHPKCLLKIAGKPLIDWQLTAIKSAGIDETAVATGYLSETLESYAIPKFHNPLWNETNMVATLLCAKKWIEGQTTILSYADILYPFQTIKRLKETEGDIVISYNTEWLPLWKSRFEDPLSDAESFKIDTNGFVTEIGNKANSISSIQGQYMGLLKITPKGWEQISSIPEVSKPKLDMTSLLKILIEKGIPVKGTPIQGNWYEIDSEQDFYLYNHWIAEKKSWLCL